MSCLYLLLVFACLVAYALRRQHKWKKCEPTFENKSVFISGGSSGIGECLCKQFIKLGARRVIIAARRLEELERVRQESGAPEKVSCVQIDLNEPRQVLATLTELFEKEPVDILVNNGGISMREEFKLLDFSVCETVLNTNLLSHIAATKAALPQMIKQQSGHIVNVSSGSGVVGLPVRTMYSASKFGLSGFGKALRSEVKGEGI